MGTTATMTLTPEQLVNEFSRAEDEVKDAFNYARGHLIRGDRDAAVNSAADAQIAMDRLLDLLEGELWPLNN
jgi:hypothetical protein